VRLRALVSVFGIPAAVCAAWTVVAGKDLNWDLLNYHYYVPYELLGGRLDQDFFAASAQSYLNPLGYVPFFLMVSSGWHSVVASVALALVHSASLGLLFLIGWYLFVGKPAAERALFAALAAVVGGATSVYWATVGTSFLDPLLLPLILGGLLLMIQAGPSAAWRAGLAGALFGAAASLKYSNAIYGLAALPLAFTLSPASWRSRCV
jgi:hypothetical protein